MAVTFAVNHKEKKEKDEESPDARFRLARLRLNDGAKLWVAFKLCFKTNNFYRTY